MSTTEVNFGKLRKIELEEQALENYCKTICDAEVVDYTPLPGETYVTEIREELSNKYVISGDSIYEIVNNNRMLDSTDIYQIKKNPDGTYSYLMQFYNGGTCLTECLEEYLEKLNKSGKDEISEVY